MCITKHCFLHDDAKYFHYGITKYPDEKLKGTPVIKFEGIPITRKDNVFGKYVPSFDDYIAETINKKFGEENFLDENSIPPLDFADVRSKDEKEFVLCMIQFVRSFSLAVKFRADKDGDFGNANDRQVSSYEDYYYDALLELYLAYS